ncbi:MAG: aminotransferase class I/II-fold pyridoxal phosphate-dependent enzyme, partial [Alphaproteobacteria bacterium]
AAMERMVVTTGSSAGFVLAFLAAFDAGDRVALAAPGYPGYRNILHALDLQAVEIATGPDSGFQPTIAHLAALDPLPDGLIVASPANPTGAMLSPEDFSALARWCHDHGVRLISDEIYHGITFGRAAATAVAHSPSAITVNSFSKYYAMTGWRLGWLVAPDDLVAAIEALAQNLFLAPPTLPQLAARAALHSHEELDGHVQRYRANRDLLLHHLPMAGFDSFAPADGAFYLYADVSARTDDSMGFCQRMLREAAVATAPGIDFDTRRGHHYLRFSFAGSTADMEEGVRRLKAWH